MGGRIDNCIVNGAEDHFARVMDKSIALTLREHIFEVSYLWTDVADNAIVELYMANVFGGDFHFSLKYGVGGTCLLHILEDSDMTNAGTELPAWNMNREGVDYENSYIYRDPTVNVDGDIIHQSVIDIGSTAIDVRFEGGRIWNDKSDHIIRVTNVSGNTIPISLGMIGHARGV